MHTTVNAPKPLAVLIATLGLLSAMPVGATIIDTLTAASTTQAGLNPATSDGPNANASYASSGVSSNDGSSDSWAGAWGIAGGAYGAGGSGNGVFDTTGNFTRSWNIINDSGVAQAYSITFFVYYGSMSASDNGIGGSGYANYSINITQGASTLFSSAATVQSDGTLLTSGTTLSGATLSGSTYSWGGTYLTLNLGILNPGDTTSLQYDLVGHAFGNYLFDSSCTGYGDGYGYGCTGSSYAWIGDPDDPNATPIQGVGVTASAVPEPSALALIGIGAAGIYARRRRGRRPA